MIYLTGFLFYEPWRLQCIACLKNETPSNVSDKKKHYDLYADLRLLFAICTAPIKHLVYPPIFVIFPISCEMTVILRWKLKQRVCNFFFWGGGVVAGANKVYFG